MSGFWFSEAVFGAFADSFEVGAVFPGGERGDDDAEDEEGFVPGAVLDFSVEP